MNASNNGHIDSDGDQLQGLSQAEGQFKVAEVDMADVPEQVPGPRNGTSRGAGLHWREFFELYWRLLYRVSTRAGLSGTEAQMVVEEAVCSALGDLSCLEVPPGNDSQSSLFHLTWRLIGAQFDCRQGKPEPGAAPSDSGAGGPARPSAEFMEMIWEREWHNHLLDRAVQQVKERVDPVRYQIYYLGAVRNWSAGRLARTFNMSRAAVYLTEFQIRRMIRGELARLSRLARGQTRRG